MKDTYVDGKKVARNGRKMATYYAASFLFHYRRVLFLHLLVFNLRTAIKLLSTCVTHKPNLSKSGHPFIRYHTVGSKHKVCAYLLWKTIWKFSFSFCIMFQFTKLHNPKEIIT